MLGDDFNAAHLYEATRRQRTTCSSCRHQDCTLHRWRCALCSALVSVCSVYYQPSHDWRRAAPLPASASRVEPSSSRLQRQQSLTAWLQEHQPPCSRAGSCTESPAGPASDTVLTDAAAAAAAAATAGAACPANSTQLNSPCSLTMRPVCVCACPCVAGSLPPSRHFVRA